MSVIQPGQLTAPRVRGTELRALTLAALGVVYGDIGTSPLYALKESLAPGHGIELSTDNVLGILSLVFWSLTLVVTLKYLWFILRADNRGEGGIMALLALVVPTLNGAAPCQDGSRTTSYRKPVVIMLGLFGAALLYGDGMITPAISVLSAVEGLQVATPAFQPMVVPITVAILVALFLSQKSGTAKLGAIFGRVMLLWFLTLAATGLPWIVQEPRVLLALNPLYASSFIARNGWHGFTVLGAVVLCITGAEALYADMGHFGKRPINLGWYTIVFPALILNYLGQGALILARGDVALDNPFFGLVSGWVLYPLVALATFATVIASQALISGAFSLTQQAIQLGYFPRMTIRHTSRDQEGQIFVPKMNLYLMLGCVALVIGFRESSNLAAAYGIAVTATMVVTSVLFYKVARDTWQWSLARVLPIVGLFLAIDLAFFSANLLKIFHGGWIPVLIAFIIFMVMTTWKRGREALSASLQKGSISLEAFVEGLREKNIHRCEGTAVFMTLTRNVAPSALLHHVKHNRTIHQRVILLSVVTEHVPSVPNFQKVRVTELEGGFTKVIARYGYMEQPDMAEILSCAQQSGLRIGDMSELSFYLGHETLFTGGDCSMATWRKKIFIFLSRNARPATQYFNIPPDRVIEVGAQLRI